MTSVLPRKPAPIVARPWPVRPAVKGSSVGRILRTTDAKLIGLMYLVTSFVWFAIVGFMALLMRAELARPKLHSWALTLAVGPAIRSAISNFSR